MEHINVDAGTSNYETLLQVAMSTAVVDNHAHQFHQPKKGDLEQSTIAVPLLKTVLSEAAPVDPNVAPMSGESTVAYFRSVKDMYDLLKPHTGRVDPSLGDKSLKDVSAVRSDVEGQSGGTFPCEEEKEEFVERTRAELGFEKLAKICFKAANISAVLIDDGLSFPSNVCPISVEEFHSKLGVPVALRVLRLESEGEIVLDKMVQDGAFGCEDDSDSAGQGSEKARKFRKVFRQALEEQVSEGVVCFKSIAAYRTSLKIDVETSDEELEQALLQWMKSNGGKLMDRTLINVVVTEGLHVARNRGIGIQFHCGLGDPDVDITHANPALLRLVLHKFADVPIILLHGAWPYTREAAFLASTYANVYVDIGLAIPLLSYRGMINMVESVFEIAPLNRIMYSSDGNGAPDMFYLGALYGRKVVAAVTASCVNSGELSLKQGAQAVSDILANNAIRLYKLGV